VPDFEAHAPSPRRTACCCIVPVINEGERLKRQLGRMAAVADQADILIADGGSTDGSSDPPTLTALGARAVLIKRGPGRLGAQLRMAFAWALDQGYHGCVMIDGNDKDDPSAVPLFLDKLSQGYDYVQGSRFMAGGRAVNTPPARWLAVRLIHAPVVSLAAGFRYTDTTNGFRAVSRRLLEDPRVDPLRDVFSGYELHYYLAIRAARLGYRVTEVPVTRAYPAGGRTPTKISPVRGNLAVLAALWRAATHRYDPEVKP
jgi:glycosyltransferase involved in cell wall biosynthesis